MRAPACRSPRAWPSPVTSAARTRSIAVVVGDAALMSRHVARGARRHRPAQDAHADRAQRQRDEHLAHCRRAQPVPEPDQAVADLARLEAQVRRLRRAGPARRPARWSSGRSRFRKSVVNFAQPGQLFEDLGIVYAGPVPGHSLRRLNFVLRRALRDMEGPVSSSTCAPRRAVAISRRWPTRSASTVPRCRR